MSAAMIISHNICLFITHRTNAEGKKEYLMLDYPGYVREKDHVGNSIPSQIHHMSNLPNVTALGFPHGREKLELDEPITTTIERVFKDRTGEVSEVDRKVMRILRAEEKRIRRSYGSDNTSEDEDGAEKISDTVLSLDAMPEDDVKSAAWLADSRDCMEELITALKEKELLSILTEKQRELYLAMTREGLTLREFARRKGIGIRAAFDLKAAVQKKFQRIF
jgi:hypothetical protein